MDFSHISFYSLSCIISFFACLSAGVFIYLQDRQDRKSHANKIFLLFLSLIAAYTFMNFLAFQATEVETYLFVTRILMLPVMFISITFFHFTVVFLEKYDYYRTFVKWGYIVSSFFILFSFSPLFMYDPRPVFVFPFYPKPGIVFHVFLAVWFFHFIYGSVLLALAYIHARTPVLKAQLRYALIGLVGAFIGGSSNYLLFYGFSVPPLTLGIGFFVLMLTYASLKHHLFSTRAIAAEVLTFIIWTFLLVKILTASQSGETLLSDSILFVAVVIIGTFLIRSGLKEEKQKELLGALNLQLDDLNHNLQKKVDEQTKEIRTAYEVEKEARVQLEKLNEAKNEFVLASQHNLRTPITIAKGYVQEADLKTKESETKTYLDKTSAVLDTLANLVNGLIDVTELEVGREGFSKKENL